MGVYSGMKRAKQVLKGTHDRQAIQPLAILFVILIILATGTVFRAWGETKAGVSSHTPGRTADLVDIKEVNPRIIVDMKYATEDNFTKKRLYDSNTCFLRKSAAAKLDAVQKELEAMNLGLKVWDCYRPLAVQRIFWAILPDERYVANPEKGSRHNRASAVDVTLVDSQGKELQMPTGFDDFSPRAAHHYQDLPDQAIRNRELLKGLMEKAGFIPLSEEWWHYDDEKWMQFDMMDLPFQDLLKHQNRWRKFGGFPFGSFRSGGIEVAARSRSHLGCQDDQGDQIRKDLETVQGVGIVPYGLYVGDGAYEDQAAIDPGVDFEDIRPKDISEAELTVVGPPYQIRVAEQEGAYRHHPASNHWNAGVESGSDQGGAHGPACPLPCDRDHERGHGAGDEGDDEYVHGRDKALAHGVPAPGRSVCHPCRPESGLIRVESARCAETSGEKHRGAGESPDHGRRSKGALQDNGDGLWQQLNVGEDNVE